MSLFSAQVRLSDCPIKRLRHVKTEAHENAGICDPFSQFFYRDHVTFNSFSFHKLNSRFRKAMVTDVSQPENLKKVSNFEMTSLQQEKTFLHNIRVNRNKYLLAKLRNNTTEPSIKEQQSEGSDPHINSIRKKLRKQVSYLNKSLLREYLHHQQPLNMTLVELNRSSDINLNSRKSICQVRKKLDQCIQECTRNQQQISNNHHRQNKNSKENRIEIETQVNEYFEKLWGQMNTEIANKVRSEGEFNWDHSIIKDNKVKLKPINGWTVHH